MLALGNFSVNSIFKKMLGSVRQLLPNQTAMPNSLWKFHHKTLAKYLTFCLTPFHLHFSRFKEEK